MSFYETGNAFVNRDKVIFGGIVGFLADMVMDIVQYPMWKALIVKHPLSHYAGSLFLDFETLHHSILGSIVSFIADGLYSVVWGILFIYIIHWTGHRYVIIKGLLYGALIWLISFGGIRALPMVSLREFLPSQTLYYLLFHLIFGLALGVLVQKWGEGRSHHRQTKH